MSGVMDLLLAVDDKKLTERPQAKVEIKRLSKMAGEPVVFTIQAVTGNDWDSIQEKALSGDKTDSNKLYTYAVMYGTKEPAFRTKELKEKYHVPNYFELVQKVLNPGEILQLYNEISDLSGFSDDAIEMIKNE